MPVESERAIMQESPISFLFSNVFEECAGKFTLIAPKERALFADGGSTLIAPDDANGPRRRILRRSNINA